MVCVLRTQPNDLVEFAAQYFAELLESRPSNNNDNCSMGITNDEHMDESMSDNDDYMDEAEGKCFSGFLKVKGASGLGGGSENFFVLYFVRESPSVYRMSKFLERSYI